MKAFENNIVLWVCTLALLSAGFIFGAFYGGFIIFSAATITNCIAFGALIVGGLTLKSQLKVMAEQSRSTENQLKLQNYIVYTKRYQEIVLNFPENINDHDFNMSLLENDERNKTMRYMRSYYDLCFEEYDLNNKGFIDIEMWRTWEGGMRYAFSKSAFQQAWKKIKLDTRYGEAFSSFVDSENKY